MININLIAERRARKLREMKIVGWSSLSALLLFVAMVAINVVAWLEATVAKEKVARIDTELQQYESQRRQLEQVRAELDGEIRPKVRLLKQVQASEGVWMTILADLTETIPGPAMLSNLNTSTGTDGVQLRLSGRAEDEKTVAAFMLAIREYTQWAKNPTLSNVTSEGDKNSRQTVRYDFTVPVEGLIGGQL